MMNKSKSKGRNAMLSLSAIPILMGLVFYFCIDFKEVAVNVEDHPTETALTEHSDIPKIENDSNPIPKGAAPSQSVPASAEPGKCYAKCILPPKYVIKEKITLYVYTGNDSNVEVEEKEIILEPATTKWVKKENNEDPDMKVWCLVDVPARLEVFRVVKDISQTDDYEVKTVDVRERTAEEGGTKAVWKEVMCNNDITADLIEKVQLRLVASGFELEVNKKFDEATKMALSKYQSKNNLPNGNLNIDTLKAMGIVR